MAENQAELRVKHIMSKSIITCRPGTTLEEVAMIMSDAEISSVVIVDEQGKWEGLISQFDLLKHFGQDLRAQKAKDCMVSNLIVIRPDELVETAAQNMLDNKIHRLIVMEKMKDSATGEEGEHAIGVISVSDIIRKMRRSGIPF